MEEGEIVEQYPIATQPAQPPVRHELDVEDLIAQVGKIHALMKTVMKKDEHYGVIPGTNKPTLLKPGAEKLCLLFRLDPEPVTVETYDGDHLTVKSTVTLYHIPTGMRMGAGVGSCSTKESKYAYRQASRKCPECGKETIIKGKEEYGGGWLCWTKKGGCGAKFADNDKRIASQSTERADNQDLPDLYNTILKMANKRALVAAVLNVTAASDIFTQDIEDAPKDTPKAAEPERKAAPVGVPINENNAAEQAQVQAAVAKWTPFLESIERPLAATRAIQEINEDLQGEPSKAVKRLLMSKCNSLGYHYDKDKKEFIERTAEQLEEAERF